MAKMNSTLHELYAQEATKILACSEPFSGSSTLETQDVPEQYWHERISECRRISQLLVENKSFSFLRLGDMELTLLLAWQEHKDLFLSGHSFDQSISIDGTQAHGDPGLGKERVERLLRAYENANYIDYHQLLRVNRALLPRLNLRRRQGLYSNSNKWTSYILPLWVLEEFQSFCDYSGRKIGIAAAEASLLEWLCERGEFRDAAHQIWPKKARVAFHQIRNNGRDIDKLLDVIKEDLRVFISTERLDTLFLSMGGGAKILCQELAEECRIRAVDFGAMTRALCDIGSDGNRVSRSTHSIHLYRLPCKLVVEGILSTRPDLKPVEKLAKVHAQLIHQLLPNRLAYSRGNRCLDLSQASRRRFKESLQECRALFSDLRTERDKEYQLEEKRFDHFCGRHCLTLRGRQVFLGHIVKDYIRTGVQRLKKATWQI